MIVTTHLHPPFLLHSSINISIHASAIIIHQLANQSITIVVISTRTANNHLRILLVSLFALTFRFNYLLYQSTIKSFLLRVEFNFELCSPLEKGTVDERNLIFVHDLTPKDIMGITMCIDDIDMIIT